METHNRHDLLERSTPNDPRNVPGSHWFLRLGSSWCKRFYDRHNFKSRKATIKMRDDLPADYEAKKNKFTYILSKAIIDNNVPDDLIVGIDETNTQFVPTVTKTRCPSTRRQFSHYYEPTILFQCSYQLDVLIYTSFVMSF